MLGIVVLAGSAWLANWIARRIVLNAMMRLIRRTPFEVGADRIGAIVSRFRTSCPP
ncbi:hypothetical protein ACFSLT_31985 [Novosphingobium resinovorum]